MRANLHLISQNGEEKKIPFSYPRLRKAGYVTVAFPEGRYVTASVIVEGYDQASVGGVRDSKNGYQDCLVYELDDGSRRYTTGCP